MSLDCIISAISSGDKEQLEYLLSVETSIDSSFTLDVRNNHLSPLCRACELDNMDIVALLLSFGANANYTIENGKTALHIACDKEDRSRNNLRIVEELIVSGADLNKQDDDGQAPIHFACTAENIEIVACLLENNGDIEVIDIDDETPLVRACYAENFELIKMLISHGCRIDFPNNMPLSMCVSRGIIPAVKVMLEKGEDIHKNEYLSSACEFNQLNMMDYLLTLGVDVNRRRTSTVFGFCPLHVACLTKSVEYAVVEKLILWGADVNLTSATGDTALHYAAQHLDCDKVKLLLQHGAPVNVKDDIEITPLTAALCSVFNPLQMCRIIQLFSAAGSKISPHVLEVVKTHHARNIDKLNNVLYLIETLSKNPLSLKDICRIQIRHTLGHRIQKDLHELQIPKLLKSYINLDDICIPSE